MLPTFSINVNSLSHIRQVSQVVAQLQELPDDDKARERVGEAYIKIIENKSTVGVVNLRGFASVCEKNNQLSRSTSSEISLLNTDELSDGFKGVTELVSDVVETKLDDILEDMDVDFYVKLFSEAREYHLIYNSVDVWRLIQLSKLDDRYAQKKLRQIITVGCNATIKYAGLTSETLRELFLYVLTKPACYNKLEEVLC